MRPHDKLTGVTPSLLASLRMHPYRGDCSAAAGCSPAPQPTGPHEPDTAASRSHHSAQHTALQHPMQAEQQPPLIWLSLSQPDDVASSATYHEVSPTLWESAHSIIPGPLPTIMTNPADPEAHWGPGAGGHSLQMRGVSTAPGAPAQRGSINCIGRGSHTACSSLEYVPGAPLMLGDPPACGWSQTVVYQRSRKPLVTAIYMVRAWGGGGGGVHVDVGLLHVGDQDLS